MSFKPGTRVVVVNMDKHPSWDGRNWHSLFRVGLGAVVVDRPLNGFAIMLGYDFAAKLDGGNVCACWSHNWQERPDNDSTGITTVEALKRSLSRESVGERV
jgi:hypothetical protein